MCDGEAERVERPRRSRRRRLPRSATRASSQARARCAGASSRSLPRRPRARTPTSRSARAVATAAGRSPSAPSASTLWSVRPGRGACASSPSSVTERSSPISPRRRRGRGASPPRSCARSALLGKPSPPHPQRRRRRIELLQARAAICPALENPLVWGSFSTSSAWVSASTLRRPPLAPLSFPGIHMSVADHALTPSWGSGACDGARDHAGSRAAECPNSGLTAFQRQRRGVSLSLPILSSCQTRRNQRHLFHLRKPNGKPL